MDVSNLPTATSTFFQASKALDLDDSVYQPPNYPFAVFDDALFNNVQFGHSMRDANFAFGSMNYLNAGAYGGAPRVTIENQKQWDQYVQQSPVSFFLRDLPTFQADIIRQLAKFVNAHPKNIFLVDNASMGTCDRNGRSAGRSAGRLTREFLGANTVFRSMNFTAEDEVIILNIGYPAFNNALYYLSSQREFKVVEIDVKTPIVMKQLLKDFEAACTPNTRLAVFDHISSSPGVILPIKEMIAICKAKGVQTFVDGAHVIGQLPLDIQEIGADYYVSNLHKWLYSAQGSAFLYAADAHLPQLHPVVISNFYGDGTQTEFLYSGTGNYTAKLTIPTALKFYEKIGGLEKVSKYCHDLAWEAAHELKRAWGTHFVVSETENENYEQYFGNMVAIALPIPKFSTAEKAKGHAQWLRDRLWLDHKIEVYIVPLDMQLYVRISAQIYNEKSDFLRLIPVTKEIYNSIGMDIGQ